MQSNSAERILARVSMVEETVGASATEEEKADMLPRLQTLRSAIGEITGSYEDRLKHVKDRNSQALDELRKLSDRVDRADVRRSFSEKENEPIEEPVQKSQKLSRNAKKKLKRAAERERLAQEAAIEAAAAEAMNASFGSAQQAFDAEKTSWSSEDIPSTPDMGPMILAAAAHYATLPFFPVPEDMPIEQEKMFVNVFPPMTPSKGRHSKCDEDSSPPLPISPSPFSHFPTPSPTWEMHDKKARGSMLRKLPVGGIMEKPERKSQPVALSLESLLCLH